MPQSSSVRLLTEAVADAKFRTKTMATGEIYTDEMILNAGALASGYNDMLGGVQINNPYNVNGVWLDSIAYRIADPAGVVGGSGGVTIQYYLGSPTSAELTLLATMSAVTAHDTIAVLGTPIQCAHNSVLRAKVTLGSATINGPVHVQWRGRYQ